MIFSPTNYWCPLCNEQVLMYNISDWLGRVASIYHETVRRECLNVID